MANTTIPRTLNAFKFLFLTVAAGLILPELSQEITVDHIFPQTSAMEIDILAHR
jgi:hypothetical protein